MENVSLKKLNELKDSLQKDIERTVDELYKDVEVVRLGKELSVAEKKYDELILKKQKEMVATLQESLDKIERNIKELKDSIADKYAPTGKIKEILDRCMCGVDWGSSKPFSIKWVSEDERFFIVTQKGHNGWAGRGCTSYEPSYHYLIDINKDNKNKRGYDLLNFIKVGLEVNGRLTKEKQEELIKKTVGI